MDVGGSAWGLFKRRSLLCQLMPRLNSSSGVRKVDIRSGEVSQGSVPFSHLCLRRLPSLPLSRASRLLRLSRRIGSLRLYTVCTWLVEAGTGRAGASCSSSGMSKATEVSWTIAVGGAIVTEPIAAVACSVHASMSMGCGAAGTVKSSIAMVALQVRLCDKAVEEGADGKERDKDRSKCLAM